VKRIFSIILSLFLTLGLVITPAYAVVKAPKVTINGKEIKFSQSTGIPYNSKSQIFVPINFVAQVMGFKTSIKGTSAVVVLPNKNITFRVGDIYNTVKTKDGKIMAPISKIAPLLGYKAETISSNLVNIKKQVAQASPKTTVQKPVIQIVPKVDTSNTDSGKTQNQNLFQTVPIDPNAPLNLEADCH
jgi:hypothetical protein